MSARRVIILCFYAQPTPRQQNLFRLFREMGWQPAFVTWDRSGGAPAADVMDQANYMNIIHLPAPTQSARLLFLMPKYWRAVRNVLQRAMCSEETPTVIIATHLFQLPLARKFRNAMWVYDTAEYFAFDISQYFGLIRYLVYPIVAFIEGISIRNMKAVLAIDSHNGWFAKHLCRYNSHIYTIPNVPAMADSIALVEARKDSSNSGKDVICYVGGISERKGLGVLLEAMKILKSDFPNILLLLVGPYLSRIEYLNEKITSMGLSDCITITGALPYSKMLAVIANAQIGLALHQRNPLFKKVGAMNGRKIFTYMQAGLSVIAPKFWELGTIVKMTNCGLLVNTESPKEIADAIKTLLSDNALRNKYKANALKAFESKYNWESVSEQLETWLIKRLNSPSLQI